MVFVERSATKSRPNSDYKTERQKPIACQSLVYDAVDIIHSLFSYAYFLSEIGKMGDDFRAFFDDVLAASFFQPHRRSCRHNVRGSDVRVFAVDCHFVTAKPLVVLVISERDVIGWRESPSSPSCPSGTTRS